MSDGDWVAIIDGIPAVFKRARLVHVHSQYPLQVAVLSKSLAAGLLGR